MVRALAPEIQAIEAAPTGSLARFGDKFDGLWQT